MTPESKDGHENYMPKPVTSKVQLNHIMLSTEVSKTLMIFWFFPGEEKPWETINRLRYRWKRLTYGTGFAMQKVNQEASPSHTAPFLRLLPSLSGCPLPPPAQVRDSDSSSHPGPQERLLSELREEQRCRAATGELQVPWELLTRLHGEVNLVKMLWTCSHSPSRAPCQDWGQYIINWTLIISTNIHF